jgi:hypothetical protein
MIEIKNIEKIPRTLWVTFISNNSNANIFHSPEMFDLFSLKKGSAPTGVCVLDNGEIKGLILGFRTISYPILTRIFVQGGVLYQNSKYLPHLLYYFNKECYKKTPLNIIDIRNCYSTINDKRIYINYKYEYDDHLNYLINVEDKDKMWSKLNQTKRRYINKALKKDIETTFIKNNHDIEISTTIVRNTCRRAKIPGPDKKFFYDAFKILYKYRYIEGFIAYQNNIPLATVIFLKYNKKILAWYSGKIYSKESNYANELLIWKILEYACNNNYTLFDFGGAGHPQKPYGVRDFKRGFGGNLTNYGVYRNYTNKLYFILIKNIAQIKYPGIATQY